MADEQAPDEPPSAQPQPPQPAPPEAVSQAHDKYFREVFSNTRYAASLLRPYLPDPVVDVLRWSSLTHLPGRFVSDDWHGREADLLFSVEVQGTGARVLVYVLLEHQSKPDRWMPLRVLNYCLQVWLKWQRDNKDAEKLPLIVPVVFYQGKEPWLYPRQFAELVEGGEAERGWAPQFEHLLIDQTELEPESVVGEPTARLAQVAMMAFSRGAPAELLEQTVRLMVEVSPAGEVEVLARHVEYVLAGTQSEERRKVFAAALRRHLPGRGGELMTYVEQIEARGELKGREAGREAGREEGLEQGLEQERRLLCRQAARKFGAEAGSRLSDLLQREADPERLAQVGEWVIECATEGELLARVQNGTH